MSIQKSPSMSSLKKFVGRSRSIAATATTGSIGPDAKTTSSIKAGKMRTGSITITDHSPSACNTYNGKEKAGIKTQKHTKTQKKKKKGKQKKKQADIDREIHEEVEALISKYDEDDDGQLSRDEAEEYIKELCERKGMATGEAEIREIFDEINLIGGGFISKEELFTYIRGEKTRQSEK